MLRKVWLTRHGESEYNTQELLGGDSALSGAGLRYSRGLPTAVCSRLVRLEGCSSAGSSSVCVWTSTLKRTIQTAQHLPFPKTRIKALDEIDAGVCDGKTYAQVAAEMPSEFAARKADKLRYRYPSGESYLDVQRRLQPVIAEVEAQSGCVCIVAHQAVLRILYGHWMSIPLEQVPDISIPLHTLIELTPMQDGTMSEERIPVDVSVKEPPASASGPEVDLLMQLVVPQLQQQQQPGCGTSSATAAAPFSGSRISTTTTSPSHVMLDLPCPV